MANHQAIMATKAKKQKSSKMLEDLPENMLQAILVRLPLKTLFASKCVCKTFLELTAPNPHFIELHSSNAPQSLLLQFEEGFRPSHRIRMVEPELLKYDFRPVFQVPDYSLSTGIILMGRVRCIHAVNDFYLVNSCNGLLYLVRKGALDECSLVCNPVTNEYIWVIIAERSGTVTRSQWLGFDASSNQYKILRISSSMQDGSIGMGAQILDLGSTWCRNIGNAPLGTDHCWNTTFTFVNGVIYWFDGSQILLFDFEKEMFEKVALPPEENLRMTHCVSIGDLGGRLALSYNNYFAHYVDIWVMGKNGNQQFWSKQISVDSMTPSGRLLKGQFHPLQILRNGELLMIWSRNDLVLYNPRHKRFRFVGLRRNLHPNAVLFRPSFVPLKDVLKVDKVFVQNVRPRSYESDRIRGRLPTFSRGYLDDGFLSL